MTKVNTIYAAASKLPTPVVLNALDNAEVSLAEHFALGLCETDEGQYAEALVNVYNAVLDQRGAA